MKNRTFRQLTDSDRAKLEVLIKEGYLQKEVAKKLGVNKSTISRELSRHSTPHGYFGKMAQARHEHKRQQCKPKEKMSDPQICEYVLERIYRGWSPETIGGKLKREIQLGLKPKTFYLNHESIYQFVYESEYGKKEKLYQYLRRGQKRRKKQHGRQAQQETIKNRVFIDERPKDIDLRRTIGHWEGDTIIYSNKKAVNSLVERKTKFVALTKLERKTAELTKQAVIGKLQNHYRETLTVDNGTENAKHEEIAKELNMKVYFCHPYHSWEKGTNENTNGLVRRYLPKRTNIDNLTQTELDAIADELNDRPRKSLNYQTPREVLEYEYQKINFSCI